MIDDVGLKPDYSNEINTYNFESPVYGKVRATVYRSADGRIEYTLMRDSDDHRWYEENNIPIPEK